MRNKHFIESELRQFKRKYWFAKLMQGILIFAGTGIVLFGIIALIEYFSWLSVAQRTWLFWLTAAVETALFLYYLAWPFLQLIILGNALSDSKSAIFIGRNLPGVKDRLVNYLELKSLQADSDLIDASLNQKQHLLQDYRFSKAVKWSSLKPFFLFLIPVFTLLVFMWSGNRWFMLAQGADRLVNYNVEYKRSLPFSINFKSELLTNEGEDFTLEFSAAGDIIPDELTLESPHGKNILSRKSGNTFAFTFNNCLNDVPFTVVYNGISSEKYVINVRKKAVVGRVAIRVNPPAYTQIAPFTIENKRVVDVPQHSEVSLEYSFKNAPFLETRILQNGEENVGRMSVGDKVIINAKSNSTVLAYADEKQLSSTEVHVVIDHRPAVDISVDSTASGLIIFVNANDDYQITGVSAQLVGTDETTETIKIPFQGALLKSKMELPQWDLELLTKVKFTITDYWGATTKVLDLTKFKEKDKTENELLGEAGSSLNEIKKEESKEDSSTSKKEKKKALQEKAKNIDKTAKELSKKDSVMYKRFEELSEEILKLTKNMDKEIPEAQKKINEKKLEEKIAALEKEWMILKTLDKLKSLEDSLAQNKKAIDKKQMDDLQKSAEELKNELEKSDEKEKVDWQKFDELKKNNEQLEKKEKKEKEDSEANEDDGEKDEKKKEEGKKEQEELQDKMKEDSESLREQLEQMSDMMMLEATKENVELLRRLELRALKTSKNQEETYLKAISSDNIDRSIFISQKEISTSATGVLDSLTAVTVSDPKMAMVLDEYRLRLENHLSEMQNTDLADSRQYVSNQRYLQYGLNDLASVLYDILKAENQNMMDAKGGSKNCKNPKPGKGKKPSLSEQQNKLGEKMGKAGQKPKPGKGKPGKQTLSQGEILDLIKGQEQILEQYNQKGGNKSGDGKLAEEIEKQIDDLIRMDLDKAIERNKSIEDKLIALEKSENQKKEQEEKRQSIENKLDYDAIRNAIESDYVKSNQRGTSIVNLPALKNYFSGKWVIINQ